MVGDKGRSVVIERAPSVSWLAHAYINLLGKPVDFKTKDYLQDPYVLNTDFSWVLMYKVTGSKSKRDKPYMIYLQEGVTYRFKDLDDLKAMVATEAGVAFILKWGVPITQGMLDLVKSVFIKVPVITFECIKRYDKYLRDCVEKETGHRPPPKQSMFVPEGFTDAIGTIEQRRKIYLEEVRVEKNRMREAGYRVNQKYLKTV